MSTGWKFFVVVMGVIIVMLVVHAQMTVNYVLDLQRRVAVLEQQLK